jgi:hypothetical protein
MQIERIHEGRIVEHWRVTDEAALARQLAATNTREARADRPQS